MMTRYVDVDKVIDVMKTAYWDENMQSAKDDPCVIDAMIDWSIRQVKDAPTEDVAPVIHAHWIDYGEVVECSHCEWYARFETHYCPNCGAIMDEEVE